MGASLSAAQRDAPPSHLAAPATQHQFRTSPVHHGPIVQSRCPPRNTRSDPAAGASGSKLRQSQQGTGCPVSLQGERLKWQLGRPGTACSTVVRLCHCSVLELPASSRAADPMHAHARWQLSRGPGRSRPQYCLARPAAAGRPHACPAAPPSLPGVVKLHECEGWGAGRRLQVNGAYAAILQAHMTPLRSGFGQPADQGTRMLRTCRGQSCPIRAV